MILTVIHQPTVLVQADHDDEWMELDRAHPLNVLAQHPLYFRITVSDHVPVGPPLDTAIQMEVEHLTKDLAAYVRSEEFQGFLSQQLHALFPLNIDKGQTNA